MVIGIGRNAPAFNYRVRFVFEVVTQLRNIQYCNSPYAAITLVTTLHTLWATPLVTVGRNSYVHAHIHLHMLMVSYSEAEI